MFNLNSCLWAGKHSGEVLLQCYCSCTHPHTSLDMQTGLSNTFRSLISNPAVVPSPLRPVTMTVSTDSPLQYTKPLGPPKHAPYEPQMVQNDLCCLATTQNETDTYTRNCHETAACHTLARQRKLRKIGASAAELPWIRLAEILGNSARNLSTNQAYILV
jgi:hypothetical protein